MIYAVSPGEGFNTKWLGSVIAVNAMVLTGQLLQPAFKRKWWCIVIDSLKVLYFYTSSQKYSQSNCTLNCVYVPC